MKVKRYITKDMNEAMIKIKNEMGNDAIILNTRKIKKPGIFGLFKKQLIEVLAAIDDDKDSNITRDESLNKALEISESLKQKSEDSPAEEQDNSKINKLSLDIDYLKGMLQTIIEERRKDKEDTPNPIPEKTEITTPDMPIIPQEPKDDQKSLETDMKKYVPKTKTRLEKLIDVFKDKGVDEDFLIEIEKKLSKFKLSTKGDLKVALKDVVDEIVGKPFTIENDVEPQKIIFFLGPTGVGKTTTLAKLSARLSLIENKKIGLITADTYRIAAVEQLRTYSEILGIPLTVIYEAEELQSSIKKYKDMDYILVDTAGRSHKSDEMQRDVKNLISKVPNKEIFLVLSATTGYKDIREIINSYNFLDDYKIIITKLDETSSIGGIINIRMLTEKPLTYFTIGQNVPDDIEVANCDRIILGIIGD